MILWSLALFLSEKTQEGHAKVDTLEARPSSERTTVTIIPAPAGE